MGLGLGSSAWRAPDGRSQPRCRRTASRSVDWWPAAALPSRVRDPRGPMFRPVSARPDFVAREHELLREWTERRTFARLRAQNAGNPRYSFLDGPITANNPMGVHHAWGRT